MAGRVLKDVYRSICLTLCLLVCFFLKAIENLKGFPTRQTMAAYIDIAKQKECFYKVRLEAIEKLAKVII